MPGAGGKRLSMENDTGAGPATIEPPSDPASEFWAVPAEAPQDDDGSAMLDIETEFRRRLSGLRRLPKWEKAVAYRRAKECYRQAMAAARENRAAKQRAAQVRQRMRWLQAQPRRSGLG